MGRGACRDGPPGRALRLTLRGDSRAWSRGLLWSVVCGVCVVAIVGHAAPIADWLFKWREVILHAGPVGMLAYSGVYALVVASSGPAAVLTVAAGGIYGPTRGVLVVWPGAMVGALTAFHASRALLLPGLLHRTTSYGLTRKLDAGLARHGGWLVLLLRLSPIFPFGPTNYALGLTGVSAGHFALGTGLGMVPGMWILLVAGAAGRGLLTAEPGSYTIATLAGLGATVGVALWLGYVGQRALRSGRAEDES